MWRTVWMQVCSIASDLLELSLLVFAVSQWPEQVEQQGGFDVHVEFDSHGPVMDCQSTRLCILGVRQRSNKYMLFHHFGLASYVGIPPPHKKLCKCAQDECLTGYDEILLYDRSREQRGQHLPNMVKLRGVFRPHVRPSKLYKLPQATPVMHKLNKLFQVLHSSM